MKRFACIVAAVFLLAACVRPASAHDWHPHRGYEHHGYHHGGFDHRAGLIGLGVGFIIGTAVEAHHERREEEFRSPIIVQEDVPVGSTWERHDVWCTDDYGRSWVCDRYYIRNP